MKIIALFSGFIPLPVFSGMGKVLMLRKNAKSGKFELELSPFMSQP